jgi:hypothetical protein
VHQYSMNHAVAAMARLRNFQIRARSLATRLPRPRRVLTHAAQGLTL